MDDFQTEVARTQSPNSYLYTTLAQIHLGEIASCIIAKLIAHGRLTAKDISVRTKIPIKNVKTALVSLIQLNCLYYWEEKDKKVFYSLKETGLLLFLYSGDIINHIKKEYGEDEAEIIQNILTYGHVRVDDYLSQFKDDKARQIDEENRFLRLFNDKWLVRLQDFDFHPLDDIWNKVYNEALAETPRASFTSETKRVQEAQDKAKIKLTTLLESGQASSDLFTEVNGVKKLKPELVITFNLERFQKHLRTNALVSLVKARIGLLTAIIFEAGLKHIESNSPDLRYPILDIPGLVNDPTSAKEFIIKAENKLASEKKITFSARDIERYLPKQVDFNNSIITPTFAKPKRPFENGDASPDSKKLKLEDGTAASKPAFVSDGPKYNSSILEQHLKLLLNGTNTAFVYEISPGNYVVPFANLTKILKQFNFEMLVKTTLGEQGFRILRCIKAMRLVDEKAISNAVLLKEKTVRSEIYHLIRANVIEIQEVPRSADRAASKTFYLFRHKENYPFLVNCLIHDMAMILNGIEKFKSEHHILLEKCNRIDVQGQEEQLLLESELKTLHGLQNREISNIVRLDRLVVLFSIFSQ
ncbi:DNA-directed RNA polymerase III subunit RPC3 [Candida viswanathii]|uniref:DNA-directed RNA polymerase III subunit RPC3 n=1 Tax=Candida viswanathii TaxID=5486 RepID=A0A367XZD9_9ASCO|nr:DNA-directed RNA polymerase III subunit RPC3 [Candida viswanathii]